MYPRRHPRAFSIVELMVVIAIITILIAITIPAAGRAREMARRASCASHLRSIGTAATNFAINHERAFPMAYQMPDPAFPYKFPMVISTNAALEQNDKWKTYGTPWQTWLKHGTTAETWQCPSSMMQSLKFYDPSTGTPAEWGACVWTDYIYVGGLYWKNSSTHNLGKTVGRWGIAEPAVGLADVKASEKVLAADTVFLTGPSASWKWYGMHQPQFQINHADPNNYKLVDWQNVLYADGHVEGQGKSAYLSDLATLANSSKYSLLQGQNSLGGFVFWGPNVAYTPGQVAPPPAPPPPPSPPSPPSPPPPPVSTPSPLP